LYLTDILLIVHELSYLGQIPGLLSDGMHSLDRTKRLCLFYRGLNSAYLYSPERLKQKKRPAQQAFNQAFFKLIVSLED
jgi:hypothetical protein